MACKTTTDESGRYCPECGAVLVETVDTVAATMAATNPSIAQSLVGQTIDGFLIEGVIGGGAFGTVYRGCQIGLDRAVAVKVPTHEIAADPVMAKRFAREARAAARINHPGVVSIYQVGELADGRPYLAMQLIDGEPLDRILAGGPVSFTRALAIVRLVASALSDTHAADVVHRDLKPSNIVWRKDRNGDDRITLVDFGIAVCKPGNADATRLTAGGLIGTPHYMSPEQAHGEVVDARADLYALGCILFELVTGATPFDGSGFEVLLAHLGRPAPLPSERNPEVPEAIDRLVTYLMAKKPEDRPQSADAVVAMIDDALRRLEGRGSPESVSQPPRARRKTLMTVRDRPMPRPRSRFLAYGVVAVLGLSAAGVAAMKLTRGTGTSLADADRGDDDEIVDTSKPSAFSGRRQVIADDGEMAARATLYDPIIAGKNVRTQLEIWNAIGAPLDASQVVITVEDPHGTSAGFTALASKRAKGRFAFRHTFAEPGHYILRVFPPEGTSVFTIDVDVEKD
jgi:serine/threonine protein kinase